MQVVAAKTSGMDPNKQLDISEAAGYLRMSERWLFEQTKANRVRHLRLGRRVFYTVGDLDAFKAANMRGPDTAASR